MCLCFLSVNNAGVGLLGPVESISIEEMKRVFDTNFFGVVRMIKEVMPDMKKRRSGHIVVMSSVMGLQGTTFQLLNGIFRKSVTRRFRLLKLFKLPLVV